MSSTSINRLPIVWVRRCRYYAQLLFPVLMLLMLIGIIGSSRSNLDLSSLDYSSTQLTEANHHSSGPADKVQQYPFNDLGTATLPYDFHPLERYPGMSQMFWLEIDLCRPGHYHRVERPPRALL